MKEIIEIILVCLIVALTLTSCVENEPINVNVKNDASIHGTVFGESALLEIGNSLWYDTTTQIVYWWNGSVDKHQWSITPSPYYAPNGLPYRYNPETNTFEEIQP